jgi:hypothetical protein
MAKLYLYQAVDIVTLKGKKVLFLCWRAHDANGIKTFHEIYKYAKYCRFKRNITSKLVAENEYCF